jgi:acetoin utilization protein AcuC
VGVVPRSWSIVWAEMTGRDLPERLPETWLDRWGPSARYGLSETMLDAADVSGGTLRSAQIEMENRTTLDLVLKYAGATAGS